ncbi:MAG: hypothetical protein EBV30_01230 [Actinobacteria bacterium]|nr:hypothetical protein [Actinomycetota bacterium]
MEEMVVAAKAPPPTRRAPARKPAPTLAPLPAPRVKSRREPSDRSAVESNAAEFSRLTDYSLTTPT